MPVAPQILEPSKEGYSCSCGRHDNISGLGMVQCEQCESWFHKECAPGSNELDECKMRYSLVLLSLSANTVIAEPYFCISCIPQTKAKTGEAPAPAAIASTSLPHRPTRPGKASSWSDDENAKCLEYMDKVVNQDQVAGVEERFRSVSSMLQAAGYNRTPLAVKNQYSRYLRQHGVDERRVPDATNLTTSAQSKAKRKVVEDEDEDSTPPRQRKKARKETKGNNNGEDDVPPPSPERTSETASIPVSKGKKRAREEDDSDESDAAPLINRRTKRARRDSDHDEAGPSIKKKKAGTEANANETGPNTKGTKRRKEFDDDDDDYEAPSKKRAKAKGKFSYVIELDDDEDAHEALGNQAGPR